MLTRREAMMAVGAGSLVGFSPAFSEDSRRRFPWGSSVFDRLRETGTRLAEWDPTRRDHQGWPSSDFFHIVCTPQGLPGESFGSLLAAGIEVMGAAFADRVEAMTLAGMGGPYLLIARKGGSVAYRSDRQELRLDMELAVAFSHELPDSYEKAPLMPFDIAVSEQLDNLRISFDKPEVGPNRFRGAVLTLVSGILSQAFTGLSTDDLRV